MIVPDLNDNEENVDELANFIKPLKNVERVELLPFQNTCVSKYKTLGIKFQLVGVENMNEAECKRLEALLRSKI